MTMMKVNTDAVVKTAANINLHNKHIHDSFSNVQNAIMQLDNCWDGLAATSALDKFTNIRTSFLEARFNIMESYASFLLQHVGIGYGVTETKNEALADSFK